MAKICLSHHWIGQVSYQCICRYYAYRPAIFGGNWVVHREGYLEVHGKEVHGKVFAMIANIVSKCSFALNFSMQSIFHRSNITDSVIEYLCFYTFCCRVLTK